MAGILPESIDFQKFCIVENIQLEFWKTEIHSTWNESPYNFHSFTIFTFFLSSIQSRCSQAVHVKKRSPIGPEVMYIVGGYLRQSLRIVECYYPSHNSWGLLKSLEQPRSGAGAAFVGTYCENTTITQKCFSYIY